MSMARNSAMVMVGIRFLQPVAALTKCQQYAMARA
jgi:hypothetical protein